jgi:ATP adenylyltransferase
LRKLRKISMDEIIRYGRKVLERGFSHATFGNLSKRMGDKLFITKGGARLDDLSEKILVLPVDGEDRRDGEASSELGMHREIYQNTSYQAVIHAHPIFSIICSSMCEGGVDIGGEVIPTIQGKEGSSELARNAAHALRESRAALIKGHGVVCGGQNLEEAYEALERVEFSCRLRYYAQNIPTLPKTPFLWAPWRMEYILSPKEEECFLCRVAQEAEDEKNYVLLRGRSNVVLLNAYPYNTGHLMVAPLRHVGNIEELDRAEREEHLDMVVQAVKIIKAALSPQGFNLGVNLGRLAGAGVGGHLHTHVVPRWEGDTNYMPILSSTKVVSEALSETYARLKKALFSSQD